MEAHPADTGIVEAMIKTFSQIIACGFRCLRAMELSRSAADFCKVIIRKGLSSNQNGSLGVGVKPTRCGGVKGDKIRGKNEK